MGKRKPDEVALVVEELLKGGFRADVLLGDSSTCDFELRGMRKPRPPKPPAEESLVALPDLPCHPNAAPRKGPAGALEYTGDCADGCCDSLHCDEPGKEAVMFWSCRLEECGLSSKEGRALCWLQEPLLEAAGDCMRRGGAKSCLSSRSGMTTCIVKVALRGACASRPVEVGRLQHLRPWYATKNVVTGRYESILEKLDLY